MESEGTMMRRRLSLIAAHLAPNQDIISASATHLLPMNCSASLNSVIRRRCDNRMNFARQASASQAYFMRQISTEQQQQQAGGGSAAGATSLRVRPPPNYASEPPLFSRTAKAKPNNPTTTAAAQLGHGDYRLHNCDRPIFSRPNPIHDTSSSKETRLPSSQHNPISSAISKSNGSEWSPRMDIAESGRNYVMTVEVPGVRISDIRVEVDDQNLTVTGHRSTNLLKMAGPGRPNDFTSAYHKREISHGPYRVLWKLPSNVNQETVSAEFVDGLLQIIIPKL